MRVLVLGGAGFVGRLTMQRLVEDSHQVCCMDVNLSTPALDPLSQQVTMYKGDITRLHDVLRVMIESKPDRVLNLAYYVPLYGVVIPDNLDLGVSVNILGMNNCFEAARICGIPRVVYSSSLAVYGAQNLSGERMLTEDDIRHGTGFYATSKIYNENQADWYNTRYGMNICGIRPANVTGTEKVTGSTEHVRCIVLPAKGEPVRFPYRDTMYCVIHLKDTADMFARITVAETTKYSIYNSGGTTVSLGELAGMVREVLPEADISFDEDEGGREQSLTYMMDNSRLRDEFGLSLPPLQQRVKEMINEVRAKEGSAPIA